MQRVRKKQVRKPLKRRLPQIRRAARKLSMKPSKQTKQRRLTAQLKPQMQEKQRMQSSQAAQLKPQMQ